MFDQVERTLSIIYEVGGISSLRMKCDATLGVSRSSKQTPPRDIRVRIYVGVAPRMTYQVNAVNLSIGASMQKVESD